MRCVISLMLLLCQVCGAVAQRSIQFSPTTWSNQFSAQPAPALRITVGDTIYTNSIDAGGLDQHGVRVAKRGNPLTGPFFVDGAEVGDILAVKLIEVRLNRDFATTLNALIPKVVAGSTGKKAWRGARLKRWHLDLARMEGSPVDSNARMKQVSIPLHPFLGCIGVAPEGEKGMGSGAAGDFGGNLDFRYNTSGATIYLPVFHPGALLYLGDGHAAQGDGELNGDALETSMSFAFTVSVLKRASFPLSQPMVEDADHLIFIAIESSLDKSVRVATEAMVSWIQTQYGLSLTEVSQVIGPAIEYRIPKIAANKVEAAALIPRKILEQIKLK